MNLMAPIPILRVFDHAMAKSFYIDWLGFALEWEHQFEGVAPRYMQVTRDACTLHLTEHYGDCSPGARVFIRVNDAKALHTEWNARTNPYMKPGIGNTPWNSICVEVVDPFGNRLTFDQSMR
ncbi:MAG: hypothetical protein AMXMBFR84_15300 [Candidatus Hydrogenedentota bacterium]